MTTGAPVLNIQVAPKSNLPKKVMVWTGTKYEVASDVKKSYLTLPKEEKQALIDYAMLLGKKPSEAKTVWSNLVDASVYAGSQGQKKNPWQILAETKSQIPAVVTAPTVNAVQYTPETAQPLVDKVYMAALGRKAKPEEVASLLPDLNAAELKTPTTTSYTKGPSGENIQTVTGGVDETSFLTNKAKTINQDDFNRYKGQQFGSWLSRAMAGQDVSGG
jgi:hypothetical protein